MTKTEGSTNVRDEEKTRKYKVETSIQKAGPFFYLM